MLKIIDDPAPNHFCKFAETFQFFMFWISRSAVLHVINGIQLVLLSCLSLFQKNQDEI